MSSVHLSRVSVFPGYSFDNNIQNTDIVGVNEMAGVSEVDWVVHIGLDEKNVDGLRVEEMGLNISGARQRRRSDMGLGKEIENMLPNVVAPAVFINKATSFVDNDIGCSPNENHSAMANFQPRRQP